MSSWHNSTRSSTSRADQVRIFFDTLVGIRHGTVQLCLGANGRLDLSARRRAESRALHGPASATMPSSFQSLKQEQLIVVAAPRHARTRTSIPAQLD